MKRGRELLRKAQLLAEKILVDFDKLLAYVNNESRGPEAHDAALTRFSLEDSDLNELLEVLTALDNLPNANAEKFGSTKTAVERRMDSKEQDLLASLYQSPTFCKLWGKPSGFLRTIQQYDQILDVAIILLPLIELFMVACKNAIFSDPSISRIQSDGKKILPGPRSKFQIAGIVFGFMEEHRSAFNELLRKTPNFTSGIFSLLLKNPKVLDFDNRYNYFTRSIRTQSSQDQRSFPTLQLSVRRNRVFFDSFRSLYWKTAEEMKFGKLHVIFRSQEDGEVVAEWFQLLTREMLDPGYCLFLPVAADNTKFHPNPLSAIVNDEHLMFFKFLGRVIGRGLYEGCALDCDFTPVLYKRILGKPPSPEDMESFDPDYSRSLKWILENNITDTDIIMETFSVEVDQFGKVEVNDLCENGRNIPVTEENKHEYVRLLIEYKLFSSVRDQIGSLVEGFHEIIPAEMIVIFYEQELELLISGLPVINVDDWKRNTQYHGFSAESAQIKNFWQVVRSFNTEERAMLLKIATGTSKVPVNGFKRLNGINGANGFNICRVYGNKDPLPSSHKSSHRLDLPEYESYEILRTQLVEALTDQFSEPLDEGYDVDH